MTCLTLNLRIFLYLAMGIKPLSVDDQGREDSHREDPQSYYHDIPRQMQHHDNNTTMREDLNLKNMLGSKHEKHQTLIETLPPRLEYLCILGYHRGFHE